MHPTSLVSEFPQCCPNTAISSLSCDTPGPIAPTMGVVRIRPRGIPPCHRPARASAEAAFPKGAATFLAKSLLFLPDLWRNSAPEGE